MHRCVALYNIVDFQVSVDAGIQSIHRIVSSNEYGEDEPIKLLICNTETIASGFVPVTFPANDSCPYPTIFVEITPEEFDSITEEPEWPKDWKIKQIVFNKED
jgi:hypothetical protein